MIRALFDTNVILDISLKREPYFADSAKLFELIEEGVLEAYISATTVTDLFYISSKSVSKDRVKQFLKDLLQVVEVAEVDRSVIDLALDSDLRDFEDAVQLFTSVKSNIEVIITRNKDDYRGGVLLAKSPKEFIEELKK